MVGDKHVTSTYIVRYINDPRSINHIDGMSLGLIWDASGININSEWVYVDSYILATGKTV